MNTPHLIDTGLNWLFQTTWQAALLAVAIAIITRVFRRKLSPGAVSLLWMLVFVRLVMPILPGSPMSIFALLGPETPPPPAATVGWAPPTVPDERWAMPTLRVVAVEPAADRSELWRDVLLATWLAGAGVMLGHVILATIRFARRLSDTARPADAQTLAIVQECSSQRHMPPPQALFTDLISTPAVFGAFRPKLLIPPAILSQLTRDELHSVILHELEHLKRRHLLSDWIFTLIKSVHWFNPAAWWSHRQIRAARELICDQAVLASLDDENTRRYGLTMLALASSLRPGPRGVPVASFAREPRLLRQRIEAIASRRRPLAWLGVMLVGALSVVFLTKPQPAPAQEPAAPATQPTTPAVPAIDPAQTTLDHLMPEVRFDAIPLADVIEFLRDVSGTNIHVNWGALERIKVERTAPTTARLREVKFGKAIQVILDDAAGEAGKLSFIVDQGVITISTTEDLKRTVSSMQPHAQAVDPQDAAVLAKLEQRLPEVRFDAIGLSDVIGFLRDISDINIFVNWRALEAAGVPRNTPVTARLRDIKFGKALETILRDVAGGKVKLGYAVTEGVLTISTESDLSVDVQASVYDIRDLLVAINGDDNPELRAALVEQIITLIKDTVASDSWKGDQPAGTIRELQGQLIITQTPANHQQIVALLDQLRQTRAIQIATQVSVIELPKARAAALGVVDPKIGWMLIDDFQMATLVGNNIRRLAAPRITTFNGQFATISASDADLAFDVSVRSTISSDAKHVTVTANWMDPPVGANAGGLVLMGKQFILTVPDGATAVMKLADIDPDRERWLAIKPTIIIQREREQEQFPMRNQRPQGQP